MTAPAETSPLDVYESLRSSFEDRYPDEPFVGVRSSRPHLAKVGNPPELLPAYEDLFVTVVQETDKYLTTVSREYPPSSMRRFFTQLRDEPFVYQAVDQAAKSTRDLLLEDKRLLVVIPIAGALPVARYLVALGVPEERICAVEISGSVGAPTGHAEIVTPLPDKLLDPARYPIFLDDHTDTVVTLLNLARARAQEASRLSGIPFDEGMFIQLENDLNEARSDPKQHELTYRKVAGILEGQQILALPVLTKNPTFIRSLSQQSFYKDNDWKRWQANILKKNDYLSRMMPNVWVLGGGMLDIGIRLRDVVRRLPHSLQNDPQVQRMLGDEDNDWLFRIGAGIPTLVNLSADDTEREEQIDNLTNLIAAQLQTKLKERRPTQPRSLPVSPV